jgi:hypothetical protein
LYSAPLGCLELGAMAQVPTELFAYGQEQWQFFEGMSSPIMNVLLVPSLM